MGFLVFSMLVDQVEIFGCFAILEDLGTIRSMHEPFAIGRTYRLRNGHGTLLGLGVQEARVQIESCQIDTHVVLSRFGNVVVTRFALCKEI